MVVNTQQIEEGQQVIADLQNSYGKKIKQPKKTKIRTSSDSPKSYFWSSFWSGLGMSIVVGIVSNILALLPGLDDSTFLLYLFGVVGVFFWWRKTYSPKFNSRGFVWGLITLTILQIILFFWLVFTAVLAFFMLAF